MAELPPPYGGHQLINTSGVLVVGGISVPLTLLLLGLRLLRLPPGQARLITPNWPPSPWHSLANVDYCATGKGLVLHRLPGCR